VPAVANATGAMMNTEAAGVTAETTIAIVPSTWSTRESCPG
jgi:hypothetical protein